MCVGGCVCVCVCVFVCTYVCVLEGSIRPESSCEFREKSSLSPSTPSPHTLSALFPRPLHFLFTSSLPRHPPRSNPVSPRVCPCVSACVYRCMRVYFLSHSSCLCLCVCLIVCVLACARCVCVVSVCARCVVCSFRKHADVFTFDQKCSISLGFFTNVVMTCFFAEVFVFHTTKK